MLVGVAIIGTTLLAWRRGSLKLLGKGFSLRIIQVYGYKCKRILFKNWNIRNFVGRPFSVTWLVEGYWSLSDEDFADTNCNSAATSGCAPNSDGQSHKAVVEIADFSHLDYLLPSLKTSRSYSRSALLPKLAVHPFRQVQTRFALQHPGNSRSTLVEGLALPLRLSLCPCDIKQ